MRSERRFWIRMEPTREDTVRALAVAAGAAVAVGAATLYVTRLLIARKDTAAAPREESAG